MFEGAVNEEDRKVIFKETEQKPSVLLLSIGVGGEGLNLIQFTQVFGHKHK
jgi:hypothetical protein